MRKRFQKFRVQFSNNAYEDHYIDIFCIESWNVKDDIVVLHMDSGVSHVLDLTEEKMVKLLSLEI